MRNGRYEEALGAFANEAARHPKDGAIKVGYALAVAHMNRERGVWAMRRALRIDPDALHYMELDDKLTYRVHGLIEAYGRALEDASPGPDETFMVAALHYLLRDRGAAQESIHRAGRDGAASTKNLARLIGEMPGAKKVPHKNEAGARKPERKKDAKPATRGSPDAATAPPRKRGKDY